jgi:hypothetical protein
MMPGKFEGEPKYVEEFWNWALNGEADEDDGRSFKFYIRSGDIRRWPELGGYNAILLSEDDNGFVYHSLSGRGQ